MTEVYVETTPVVDTHELLSAGWRSHPCAAKVCEVCVETTVVVDTLGPARRRTHGLCVTVRCHWKKRIVYHYLHHCSYLLEWYQHTQRCQL